MAVKGVPRNSAKSPEMPLIGGEVVGIQMPAVGVSLAKTPSVFAVNDLRQLEESALHVSITDSEEQRIFEAGDSASDEKNPRGQPFAHADASK